jgi:hypothetical protein
VQTPSGASAAALRAPAADCGRRVDPIVARLTARAGAHQVRSQERLATTHKDRLNADLLAFIEG